jgi:hypothetical protein
MGAMEIFLPEIKYMCESGEASAFSFHGVVVSFSRLALAHARSYLGRSFYIHLRQCCDRGMHRHAHRSVRDVRAGDDGAMKNASVVRLAVAASVASTLIQTSQAVDLPVASPAVKPTPPTRSIHDSGAPRRIPSRTNAKSRFTSQSSTNPARALRL